MEDVVIRINIPWPKIGLLLGRLVKASAGGITRTEADELVRDLIDIATMIGKQL